MKDILILGRIFLILLLCLPQASETNKQTKKKCTKRFKVMIKYLIAKASLNLNPFSHSLIAFFFFFNFFMWLSMLGSLCCYVLWELEDLCGNQKIHAETRRFPELCVLKLWECTFWTLEKQNRICKSTWFIFYLLKI